MADEKSVAQTASLVSEAKVEEVATSTKEEPAAKNINEEFESALERITSKLWDDRSRNKSKGKRKRLSKEEEKNLIDLLIGALSGSQNETESLEVMARRFLQMVVENKTSESKIDELSRRCSLLVKDKEDLTGQYKKSRLALTKLESLCRELQKHNRLMKEECDHRTKAEEAKRQELSSKFQSSIGEITNQMQDNHSKNQQLKTDNAELAAKLKGLVDQYEMREQYVDKVLKHKQVENQLLEAKLAQQTLILNEEREQALKEKQQLLQESLEYQKKCERLVKEEAELKLQLSMYTEKFEEFQKTLTKSNEVFGTFKKEMDKMTKTIKKLEKETMMWKQKWEKSNLSLLEIAGDNRRKEQQVQKVTQKNDKLEKLCRALQIERKELSQKLEGNKPLGETSKGPEQAVRPTSTERVALSIQENGHYSGDSELKPEAEQVPCEMSVNNPKETESDLAEAPCNRGQLDDGKESENEKSKVSQESVGKSEEASAEGIGDEHNEATEDEWQDASRGKETNTEEEREYCEADQTAAEDDQDEACQDTDQDEACQDTDQDEGCHDTAQEPRLNPESDVDPEKDCAQ